MATAVFVQDGASVDYTPTANVSAGDVVVQGDLVGVAKRDIAANALGALAVTGVFDVPKAVGTALAVGTRVHWNAAARQATTAASGNRYLGKTVGAALAADATVRVRLEQ